MKKASLVGAFFVSVFWTLQALAFCPAAERLPLVEVARVVDGDTLRLVDGRSVRLIGINTPERSRHGRKAEAFAEAAWRHLDTLVKGNGERVGLSVGREPQDRHGRVLAHVYDAQGRNLEAALLAEGLGYAVAVAPNTELAGCHWAAEEHARRAGKGVWRKPALQTAHSLRQAGFALVGGKVERVERNRAGFWLELDGPLVVHVPLQAVEAFDAQRLSVLAGKTIEVRGWVVDRRGRAGRKEQARWMLRLTHPAMLSMTR